MPEPAESKRTVKGACVLCNTDIELVLGEPADSIRYYLAERVYCKHCGVWLTAAIKDAAGRFWGRRRIWNE